MTRPSVSLQDIFIFVEVAKRRGFTAAAESVGLPIATISRRVSTLEQQLGLKLFNRSTRRIELTAGELRISALPGLSALLPAILGKLHRQYPDVSYDIELGTAQAALYRPGLDLMLRFGARGSSWMRWPGTWARGAIRPDEISRTRWLAPSGCRMPSC
ncbi:LysR family transcriptional regulator [Bordetella petrii]|uniref:LysR family transcriptional regulator n=1 Tax=Bordetella petrii TaxID=94624 RepID=UPI001F605F4F|nr:LysR family transcriptional regulator [Bordetella petrii]